MADRRVQVPALPVGVVDTTGAGDAFAAGLIVALTAELDDEAALVLGNTMGGLAVTRSGAGEMLPTTGELLHALATGWTPDHRLAAAADRARRVLACRTERR